MRPKAMQMKLLVTKMPKRITIISATSFILYA